MRHPMKARSIDNRHKRAKISSPISRKVAMASVGIAARKRVNRCLFGKPDKQKLDEDLRKGFEKIEQQNITKYGFDFANDVPLEDGPFEFEALHLSDVPSVYHPCKARSRYSRLMPPPMVKEDVASSSNSESEDRFYYKRRLASPGIEISEDDSSVSSRTRSHTRKENNENTNKELRQATITNYLCVRKRRSNSVSAKAERKRNENNNRKGDAGPSRKALRFRGDAPGVDGGAPGSPFRFVKSEKNLEIGDGEPSTSSDGGPPRKTQKRGSRNLKAGDCAAV